MLQRVTSLFSVEIFCLAVPKNFVGEPFSVSLISGIGKTLCFRGLCHDFPSKIFLSHSAETFRRGTLLCCVSENFWWRKSLWIRGRGRYQKFLSKSFCLTVPKNFVEEPFRVSLIRVSKNFMLQRVMSRYSVEKFLCHSTEPFHRGPLLCCVSENFW